MTADELIRANENPPAPTKVRISHKWGEGEWSNIAHHRVMSVSVRALNLQHGPGTHLLEFEA